VGRTATIIAVSYTIVSVLAIVFTAFIALSTRSRRKLDDERTLHTLGEHERTWFVVVIALLVALLFATIFFTPYGKSAGPDAQIQRVSALQFAWIMQGKPIRAGTPVEFELTSRDVNHNFGVYTASGRFLFQVQVVPGKTQRYVYTFDKPGTYQVLCLEYCGLGHNTMQTSFTVR
jgi:cytochrome c oxidase subunit II